jgi:recombination protein RecA
MFDAAQLTRGPLSRPENSAPPRFVLAELAGRLVELSGDGASATLTLALGLVLDAQREGEPVAWISADASTFYPPDAAMGGVDLNALVVVRVSASKLARSESAGSTCAPSSPSSTCSPRAKREAGPGLSLLATAAERLLRSGAFGLVVLDLGKDASLSQPLQSRLLGLAQHHHSAVLCLTQKPEQAPSLGSLVSLRAQATRSWLGQDRFVCELSVKKDKRRGPVWSEREVYRGPLGLR